MTDLFSCELTDHFIVLNKEKTNKPKYYGIQVYRSTCLQVYMFTGLQVYMFTGLQVYMFTGLQV